MRSAWALKALRTELYASCSSWWIWASMSVSPYILEYGRVPIADLPLPATRPPLGILFWWDGGRSSSVPAISFILAKVKTRKHQWWPRRLILNHKLRIIDPIIHLQITKELFEENELIYTKASSPRQVKSNLQLSDSYVNGVQ